MLRTIVINSSNIQKLKKTNWGRDLCFLLNFLWLLAKNKEIYPYILSRKYRFLGITCRNTLKNTTFFLFFSVKK